jgi:ferrous iron transport protein A
MMPLAEGKLNTSYTVNCVNTKQEDVRKFLFTLGCYPGERVTIISKLASNYIVNIKDARYSIDEDLAKVIMCSNHV